MSHFLARFITGGILIALFFTLFFFSPPVVLSFLLLAILIFVLMIEWPQLCKPASFWFLTPLYPILPFLVLIYLNHVHHELFFVLIVLVACFDSTGYIIGSKAGFHKIVPTISPGKSWEGAIGGFFITYCLAQLISVHFAAKYGWIIQTSVLFLLCITALIGDLFESWLKRRVGIKDTAAILPGHGGFLDRFDGIMFAGVGLLFLLYLKNAVLFAPCFG